MRFLKPFFFLFATCFSDNKNSSFIVEFSRDKFVSVGSIINIKNDSVDIYSTNLPFKLSTDFTLIGKKTINLKECVVLSVKIGPFIRKNVNICNRFHENKSIVLADNGDQLMVLKRINHLQEGNNINDYDNINRYDLLT
jgi:hypothetical protein